MKLRKENEILRRQLPCSEDGLRDGIWICITLSGSFDKQVDVEILQSRLVYDCKVKSIFPIRWCRPYTISSKSWANKMKNLILVKLQLFSYQMYISLSKIFFKRNHSTCLAFLLCGASTFHKILSSWQPVYMWKVWQEGQPVCEYCAERKLRNEHDKLFGIERKGICTTSYLVYSVYGIFLA